MEFAAGALDLGEDVGGGGRPDKRRRSGVVVVEVGRDCFDQLGQAAEDSAPQAPGGQVTKEALHHVEPRGTRRSKVQMKTGMLFQPRFDLWMFVRGVVIEDQMQ